MRNPQRNARAGRGTFDSEDLATAAKSVTTNSSQLAADQRGSGKLFGVRWVASGATQFQSTPADSSIRK